MAIKILLIRIAVFLEIVAECDNGENLRKFWRLIMGKQSPISYLKVLQAFFTSE
jgi:hypothetical protein